MWPCSIKQIEFQDLAFPSVVSQPSHTLVLLQIVQQILTDKDQLTSTLLMTAGMALLYQFDIDTPKSWYIGAQVLFGFGVGFGNQVPVTAVQGLSKPEDVPSSTALIFSKCSFRTATIVFSNTD